jgi:PKD repeat protein
VPRLAVVTLPCRKVLVPLVLAAAFACLQTATAFAMPAVDFTYTPNPPLSQEEVTFESTSQPGALDRTITKQEWDLNDDGDFSDDSGVHGKTSFDRPGPHYVSLRVTDDGLTGPETAVATKRVDVGNRPPVSAMVILPAAPVVGERVTFIQSAYDPDGFISKYRWELDGNGKFDDGTSSSESTIYKAAGRYLVGLKVTDNNGASATLTVLLDVKTPSQSLTGTTPGGGVTPGPSPGGGSTVLGVRLLSPFPVVRVSGIVQRAGTRLRVLSVTAPVGATVRVRCAGRTCPFRRSTKVVKSSARSSAAGAPGAGIVKVRRFAHRLLAVGTAIKVFVTKPDAIGKYTRLRIRRAKFPARVDRCLPPANLVPFPCPSG